MAPAIAATGPAAIGGVGRQLGLQGRRMPQPELGRQCGIGPPVVVDALAEQQAEALGREAELAGDRHEIADAAHRSAAPGHDPAGRRRP